MYGPLDRHRKKSEGETDLYGALYLLLPIPVLFMLFFSFFYRHIYSEIGGIWVCGIAIILCFFWGLAVNRSMFIFSAKGFRARTAFGRYKEFRFEDITAMTVFNRALYLRAGHTLWLFDKRTKWNEFQKAYHDWQVSNGIPIEKVYHSKLGKMMSKGPFTVDYLNCIVLFLIILPIIGSVAVALFVTQQTLKFVILLFCLLMILLAIPIIITMLFPDKYPKLFKVVWHGSPYIDYINNKKDTVN